MTKKKSLENGKAVFNRIRSDARASNLVESLLIIAVGFLILLILIGMMSGAFDWVISIFEDFKIDFDNFWPSTNLSAIINGLRLIRRFW